MKFCRSVLESMCFCSYVCVGSADIDANFACVSTTILEIVKMMKTDRVLLVRGVPKTKANPSTDGEKIFTALCGVRVSPKTLSRESCRIQQRFFVQMTRGFLPYTQ